VPGSARPINSIAMLGWGPSHTLKHHTRKCSIEGVNIYLPETTEEGQYTKFSMQSSWGHPSNGDTPPTQIVVLDLRCDIVCRLSLSGQQAQARANHELL